MTDRESNTFKYVAIARDGVILVDYPPNQADMQEKTLKILKKLDTSSPFSVIEQNNLLFTASTDSNKIVFFCICDKKVETRHIGKFLTNLKQQWTQNYGAISQTISPGEKNNEFSPKIQEMFDSINEKLRPTLLSQNNDNQETPETHPTTIHTTSNIDHPLLENNEQESALPNPFAPRKNNYQDEILMNTPEIFDDDMTFEQNRGTLAFIQRNRYKILLAVALILLIYFIFAFYCSDFNLFRCSGA